MEMDRQSGDTLSIECSFSTANNSPRCNWSSIVPTWPLSIRWVLTLVFVYYCLLLSSVAIPNFLGGHSVITLLLLVVSLSLNAICIICLDYILTKPLTSCVNGLIQQAEAITAVPNLCCESVVREISQISIKAYDQIKQMSQLNSYMTPSYRLSYETLDAEMLPCESQNLVMMIIQHAPTLPDPNFWREVVNRVDHWQGTLHQTSMSSIVAIWGLNRKTKLLANPQACSAYLSCRCAIEIRTKLLEVGITSHIAIHGGSFWYGVRGTSKTKFVVIGGPAWDTTMRLGLLCDKIGSNIIVSHTIQNLAHKHFNFHITDCVRVSVDVPVMTIFELTTLEHPIVTDPNFSLACHSFMDRDYPTAKKLLLTVQPQTAAARRLCDRLWTLLKGHDMAAQFLGTQPCLHSWIGWEDERLSLDTSWSSSSTHNIVVVGNAAMQSHQLRQQIMAHVCVPKELENSGKFSVKARSLANNAQDINTDEPKRLARHFHNNSAASFKRNRTNTLGTELSEHSGMNNSINPIRRVSISNIVEETVMEEQTSDVETFSETEDIGSGYIEEGLKNKPMISYFTDLDQQTWCVGNRRLGKGSFGEVHLGMDTKTGRLVAIKQLPIRKGEGENIVEDMLNEVGLLSQFHHKNIVSYVASAYVEGCLLVVMEYVAGGTLSSLIRDFGYLDVHVVVCYAADMARGLNYLHRHGILHRDVKPHNVLVQKSGVCKLADFGISCSTNANSPSHVGTIYYMSPEAARQEWGKPSDVFSFGVTVYEMLTGQLPFIFPPNDSMITHAFRLKQGQLPPLSLDSLPNVQAISLVEQCMDLDPTKRPTPKQINMHSFFDIFGEGCQMRSAFRMQKQMRRRSRTDSLMPTPGANLRPRSPFPINVPNDSDVSGFRINEDEKSSLKEDERDDKNIPTSSSPRPTSAWRE